MITVQQQILSKLQQPLLQLLSQRQPKQSPLPNLP
jgi:hypothetical protein